MKEPKRGREREEETRIWKEKVFLQSGCIRWWCVFDIQTRYPFLYRAFCTALSTSLILFLSTTTTTTIPSSLSSGFRAEREEAAGYRVGLAARKNRGARIGVLSSSRHCGERWQERGREEFSIVASRRGGKRADGSTNRDRERERAPGVRAEAEGWEGMAGP